MMWSHLNVGCSWWCCLDFAVITTYLALGVGQHFVAYVVKLHLTFHFLPSSQTPPKLMISIRPTRSSFWYFLKAKKLITMIYFNQAAWTLIIAVLALDDIRTQRQRKKERKKDEISVCLWCNSIFPIHVECGSGPLKIWTATIRLSSSLFISSSHPHSPLKTNYNSSARASFVGTSIGLLINQTLVWIGDAHAQHYYIWDLCSLVGTNFFWYQQSWRPTQQQLTKRSDLNSPTTLISRLVLSNGF